MNEKLTEKNEFKEKELFGRNIEVHAYFLRHAPEDKETKHLTEEGAQISKKYAEEFEAPIDHKNYLIKAYSSEMNRAKETAETIIEMVNASKKGRTRVNLELGEKTEDVRMPIDALNLPFSEYIKECRKEERINDKPISLHDVAQRIGKQIKHFIEMSKRFKNDSKVDLLNITHMPWLSAFLKEVVGQEIEKETDLKKRKEIEKSIINIGHLEGFEVLINRDGDDVFLTLKFKDKKFSVTEEDIQKLLSG